MKKLENLEWKPMWGSHLGCIKGCLNYLGINMSEAWLFGTTGHAFLLNMHEAVCPSGPTAWKSEKMYELGKNVGFQVEYIEGFKNQDDFADKQKQAWEMVKDAIDNGLPCIGWELTVPEYYVVNGYDNNGYHYSGPIVGEFKPKPWNELGDTGIGVLFMGVVNKTDAKDDITAVKKALDFVLEYAKYEEYWLPKYKGGLQGYDSWIEAIKNGTADNFGMAYNSVVWCECRLYAVEFLEEARERLPEQISGLLEDAKVHYKVVADCMKQVSELFSFPPKEEEIKNEEKCGRAVELIQKARDAEELGLKTIEEIAITL